MAKSIENSNPWVGIGWMLVTGFLFVGVTGIVRHIGHDLPAAEAAFIRYVIGLFLIIPLVWKELKLGIPRKLLTMCAFRGFAHAFAVILWFYAMARIPIAEVTAIGYTAPIYITLGAVIFFGEKLAARRILAVLAAFVGAMVVIRPGFQEVSIGQLAQLASAPLFAASYLMAKQLAGVRSPQMVVAMLSIFVTIGLAPFAIANWRSPTLEEVSWMGAVAVLATLGHLTMTKALAAAPLMVTQPVTFLQLVWATMLGAMVFGEAVDVFVLLGGGIIIVAVSFISYREWVVARQQKAALSTEN